MTDAQIIGFHIIYKKRTGESTNLEYKQNMYFKKAYLKVNNHFSQPRTVFMLQKQLNEVEPNKNKHSDYCKLPVYRKQRGLFYSPHDCK